MGWPFSLNVGTAAKSGTEKAQDIVFDRGILGLFEEIRHERKSLRAHDGAFALRKDGVLEAGRVEVDKEELQDVLWLATDGLQFEKQSRLLEELLANAKVREFE